MRRLSAFFAAYGRPLCSFGAIQAAQLFLPLLALPWLGRVLGQHAFGLLMYMCIIPPIVALFMDWGLAPGGARLAALQRGRKAGLSRLLAQVFSAKLILALACAAAGMAAMFFLPHARDWPAAYCLAILAGISRGISPIWFFQGTGSGRRSMALFDVCASICVLSLVFACVHSPDSWPLYLFFLAFCKGAAYLWISARLWRQYSVRFTLKGGLAILGRTRTLFAGSLSAMIYTNGAQLSLAYFLPVSQMGVIVAAAKMLRAVASLVTPFTQTIFPEVCVSRDLAPRKTRMILRASLCGTALAMFLAACAICVLAPWIILVALGPDYAQAVSVLRVMIFAAPLMGCGYVLGAQTLVPFGQERALAMVQGAMALASLPLAAMLAHFAGLYGAAILPVCVEGCIVLGLFSAVLRLCPQALFSTASAAARNHGKGI